MKSSELRIGNWVSVNTAQGGWWLDQQVAAGDFGVTAAGTLLVEAFEPIPLTKEWLLKFGFENKSGNYYLKINELKDFILQKEEVGYMMCDIDILVNIKYVHQLQNLIYALTGEELTIK